MAKKNEKLVYDYINGNSIDDDIIDKLENNKCFIETVMSITNDKNLYGRCSDKIKTDTGFIRFLIKHFINDVDFLCSAADYYFENTKDDDNKIEIAIIMSKVTKKNDDDRCIKYSLMKNVLYSALRLQVEYAKEMNEDDFEFQEEVGLGFYYVFDLYKNNKIVVDFYAKKMLMELFVDDYYSLENILHEQYSTPEEILEKGSYNCLLNVVRVYDDMLYSYLCVNKSLLSVVLPKFNHVLRRWDKYVDRNEMVKYDLIYEKVYDYLNEREYIGILSASELLTYIGNKIGILDKLEKYDLIEKSDIDLLQEDTGYYEEVISSNFNDRINYNNIKRLLTSVLFEKNMDKLKVEKEEIKDSKIVNIDDYRKNKSLKLSKN